MTSQHVQSVLLLGSAFMVCLLAARMILAGQKTTFAPLIVTAAGRHASVVVLLGAIVIWQGAQGLEFLLPEHAVLLHRIGFAGIILLSPAVFRLGQQIAGYRWPPVPLLFAVPIVTLVMNFSGPFSQYFWTVSPLDAGVGTPLLTASGPWFWVHAGYSYLCLTSAFILFSRHYYRHPLRRREGAAVLLALMLPVAANIIELSVSRLDAIAVTALALAGTAVLIAWAAKQDETRLLEPWARQRIVDAMVEPVMVLDQTDTIVFSNPSGQSFLGVQSGESIRVDVVPQLAEFVNSDDEKGEIRVEREGQELRFEAVRSILDSKEKIRVITLRDVTEERRSLERIHHLAHYDALTGLPNRRLFRKRLEKAVASALSRHALLAVLSLDIDRFKQINDTLGHAAGDRLLQIVAEQLLDTVRPSDHVATKRQSSAARLGGDEFTVLLTGISDTSAALAVADRIRQRFDTPISLEGKEVLVGISIGVACFPDGGTTSQELLRRADQAMYHAKANPGSAVEIGWQTEPSDEEFDAAQFDLEVGLRHALERDEFELHYQPIVDAAEGRLVGTEALIRWRHPDGHMAAPSEFIERAEDTGLIVSMGRWAIATAAEQVLKWQQVVPDFTVGVNVSPVQLRDEGFLFDLASATQTGASPSSLKLELTEGVLVHDFEHCQHTLRQIAEMGIQLVLDDFGTGYSSLSYLHQLPFSTVKIDRSFTRDLPSCDRSRRLCRAIIDMAHGLDLAVVAEGAENKEQHDCLRELGCDQLQGYWSGKPMPATMLDELLEREAARRTIP